VAADQRVEVVGHLVGEEHELAAQVEALLQRPPVHLATHRVTLLPLADDDLVLP